jgi:hypothetical protein
MAIKKVSTFLTKINRTTFDVKTNDFYRKRNDLFLGMEKKLFLPLIWLWKI